MISYASNRTKAQIKVIRQSMEDASPWHKLVYAIVRQAVKDYRMARSRTHANPMIATQAEEELRQLEGFFRSPWFKALTDVDGDLILTRLKKEAA